MNMLRLKFSKVCSKSPLLMFADASVDAFESGTDSLVLLLEVFVISHTEYVFRESLASTTLCHKSKRLTSMTDVDKFLGLDGCCLMIVVSYLFVT